MPSKRKRTNLKSQPALPHERGMPAPEHVKEVTDFVSPQGVKYQILKTDETDAYDPPPVRRKSKK